MQAHRAVAELSFRNQCFAWGPISGTPVLLPGKSHGQRSLVGCSPWSHEESYMAEQLHFQFSLSCTGEGNGNPLQCSCLESPRDRGAWWAAIYGVAQSRTRLMQLSCCCCYKWQDLLSRMSGPLPDVPAGVKLDRVGGGDASKWAKPWFFVLVERLCYSPSSLIYFFHWIPGWECLSPPSQPPLRGHLCCSSP